MLEMTHRDWEWVLGVDLWGVIHGVEVFAPRLVDQAEGGHIVNTASFAGMVPHDGLSIYCVAKYGVVALSECLYRELSPYNITVSVLCPMRVETNIDQSIRNRQPEFGGSVRRQANDREQPDYTAERQVTADDVGVLVRDAIKSGRQYIFTHPESRGFIQRRFARIDRAFADQGLT
ncbi:MAG TPA: SDR family NAD(P)-dependent oxidoreductase [Dehalococcoidia bacterium]|nr:SDR family NAD(P)-dependent oxidoreductase [Dehalococcoidia bacterium]